jgi:hypothetical protein
VTLNQTVVYNTSANGGLAGIWWLLIGGFVTGHERSRELDGRERR